VIGPEVPGQPPQVSASEWDEMVRDVRATATEEPAPGQRSADATPEDLVMKDPKRRDKQRKPKNRKHGRPR
jgi:SecD/SecF fusion protein